MKIKEYELKSASRSDIFKIYPIGDVHLGAMGCNERAFMSVINLIKQDKNAYWIGGGDYLDAVIFPDLKRFDPSNLPDWMFSGKKETVRENLSDILKAQKKRFLNLVEPIRDKCLGLIEGNHEYEIYRHHNRNITQELCDALEVENLTDCAFLRLCFRIVNSKTKECTRSRNISIFICHGRGSGRSPGAEPNKLHALALDKDVDIILSGHTHNFYIMPPITILTIPYKGALPKNPLIREKHAANWGTYLQSYLSGPSTYISRGLYPSRAFYTAVVHVKPHSSKRNFENPEIEIKSLKLQ